MQRRRDTSKTIKNAIKPEFDDLLMTIEYDRIHQDCVYLRVSPPSHKNLVAFLDFCQATNPMQTIDIIQDGNTFPEELENMKQVFTQVSSKGFVSISKWRLLKLETLLRAFTELGQSVFQHGGAVSDAQLKELQQEVTPIVEEVFHENR